ncbi:ChaN family lipoprotein [Stutzerimonas chloritidismutans]|uniref:ChaN family lipoprotein n=1 Tax=Stutzerimonas chloritidismutans TaxID=203192 RepID=UPI003F17218C
MRLLILFVAAVLSGCPMMPPLPAWQSPNGVDHPDAGRIVDLRDGTTLDVDQLVERLAKADRLLIGERHDNPDHHALQLWLLQALAQRREQGSLLMEMINPDQQERVRQAQTLIAQGQPPKDVAGALAWQDGWDWTQYGPLVRYALAQAYPLLQANLDRGEIKEIYRSQPEVNGRAADPKVRATLLEQIRVSHCDMLPASQLPAMLAVQQQRDRRMAEQLTQAPAPAALLAGGFHVRRDLGVPLYLVDEPAGDVLVLLLAEVGDSTAAQEADIVWFTPAMPQRDYCARFRQDAG